MELTLGEIEIITNTLYQSLAFVNWDGFTKETRQRLLNKLLNDTSLKFKLEIIDENKVAPKGE